MKHKIYFIIGASGSGKTTTLQRFEKNIPEYCTLIHFDSIGIPSFEEMEQEYGSIEEWQRVKTIDWIKKLAKEQLSSSNVIFDAQIRPSFIKEACDLYGVDYEILLFDCSDTERTRRLISRGHSELADENMRNWAAFLRKECQKHHHKIINNSHMTVDQTLELFNEWLHNQLNRSFPYKSHAFFKTDLQAHLISSEKERKEALHFRQRHFFDRMKMQDPYRWALEQKDHLHWLLYNNGTVIGYAHVQIWPEHRAALRIIVIDEQRRGTGMGKYLMDWCEKELKNQGIILLQTEASPTAYLFYKKLGYIEMPFNNPNGEPTHPDDRAMGKYL